MAFDWTADALDLLRRLWAEGLSTAQIGQRLGCTRNAVIGKAHRLNLPPRPSPIRSGGQRMVVRAVGKSLMLMPQAGGEAVPLRERTKPQPKPADQPKPLRLYASQHALAAPVIPPRAPLPRQEKTIPLGSKANKWSTPTCCWIFGDPKKDGLRFCDAPRREGKAYCAEHCALAYVPNEKRPEAA